MKKWHRLSLPANYRQTGPNTRFSNMSTVYAKAFDYNIEWNYESQEWGVDTIKYRILCTDQEMVDLLQDLTYTKLCIK